MRQEQFVARHQHEWRQLEHWLQQQGRRRNAAAGDAATDAGVESLAAADIPQRYRRLCQQLALARRRGYSPQLLEHLQQLMQQGHALLYRAPPPRWRRAAEFLLAGFPRLVRAHGAAMALASALFALPLVAIFGALQLQPELVHQLLDPDQVQQVQRMYAPRAERLGRDSGGDWAMFGVYILNNISIGLRTFASGLLAGIGTLLVLVHNGITIGAVAGHLQQAGAGDPFWRFVAGHAPLELTAIVIAGGAGLQLGHAVIAPGRRRRRDALVHAGVDGARLCLGVAVMLLLAAFVEAFWSSIGSIPAWGKYTVSAVLWLLVLGWLWRGGRGGGDAA